MRPDNFSMSIYKNTGAMFVVGFVAFMTTILILFTLVRHMYVYLTTKIYMFCVTIVV